MALTLLRSSKFGGAAAAGAGTTAGAGAAAMAGGATGTLMLAAVGNTARRSPKARNAGQALRVTLGATTLGRSGNLGDRAWPGSRLNFLAERSCAFNVTRARRYGKLAGAACETGSFPRELVKHIRLKRAF